MTVDYVSGAIVNVTDPKAGSGPIIGYYRVTGDLARIESSRDRRLDGLACPLAELPDRVQVALGASSHTIKAVPPQA
jgi:hypothetical protein